MDKWREAWRTTWQTLRANGLRTWLTALSMALGAAAIALMLSVASSAMATILSGVDAVGGREIIFIEPHRPEQASAQQVEMRLTPQDAAALRARVPGILDAAYLDSMRDQVLQVDGRKADADLAIGQGFMHLLMHRISHGSDLPPIGAEGEDRAIVLSRPIAEKLFDDPAAAIGKSVTLWGNRYVVVGVASPEEKPGFNMGGVSKDRAVFLSVRAMVQREGWEPDGFIVMRAGDTPSHDLQMRMVRAILLYRHRGVEDFELMDLGALIGTFDKVFAGLEALVGLIASTSLVIAGAGIMNVLLASIRQRIAEIGIRRAVGASRADIRRQFMLESLLVATLGGVGGALTGTAVAVVLGLAASHVVPGWANHPSWLGGLFAVIAAAVTGLVFGLRPARMAAGLDVVACLRGNVG